MLGAKGCTTMPGEWQSFMILKYSIKSRKRIQVSHEELFLKAAVSIPVFTFSRVCLCVVLCHSATHSGSCDAGFCLSSELSFWVKMVLACNLRLVPDSPCFSVSLAVSFWRHYHTEHSTRVLFSTQFLKNNLSNFMCCSEGIRSSGSGVTYSCELYVAAWN